MSECAEKAEAEAAGLVDILARLTKGGLHQWRCQCGAYSVLYPDSQPGMEMRRDNWYIEHTPDCPWVEGMIVVAERQGNA